MTVDEFIEYLERQRDKDRERCRSLARQLGQGAPSGVYAGRANAYADLARQLKTRSIEIEVG